MPKHCTIVDRNSKQKCTSGASLRKRLKLVRLAKASILAALLVLSRGFRNVFSLHHSLEHTVKPWWHYFGPCLVQLLHSIAKLKSAAQLLYFPSIAIQSNGHDDDDALCNGQTNLPAAGKLHQAVPI